MTGACLLNTNYFNKNSQTRNPITRSTLWFNSQNKAQFHIPGVTMNTFDILVRIVLALFLLYILWHGNVVIVAYRWKQEDKLISRALAPRDEVR
jgi:hypothetical protein